MPICDAKRAIRAQGRGVPAVSDIPVAGAEEVSRRADGGLHALAVRLASLAQSMPSGGELTFKRPRAWVIRDNRQPRQRRQG